MGVLFSNLASSLLAASITDSATSLSVTSSDGSKFPSPTGGDWFPVVVVNGSTREIMRCTGRSGDILTVTRAQEGTAAAAFDAGARVDLRLTKAALDDFAHSPVTLEGSPNYLTIAGQVITRALINLASHVTGTLGVGNGGTGGTTKATARTSLEVPGLNTSNTFSAPQTFGDGSGIGRALVNGADGSTRDVQWQTDGSARWVLRATSDEETGSNAGSDLRLAAHDDSGSFLSQIFKVDRATGVLEFNEAPTLDGEALVRESDIDLDTDYTRETEVATTSGSQVTFTGIPAGVSEIVITFEDVRSSSDGHLAVTIGDSGGIETSEYISSSGVISSSPAATSTAQSFIVYKLGSSLHRSTGVMTLYRRSGNMWFASHGGQLFGFISPSGAVAGGGFKELSGELTRVRIATTAGSFNLGSVNIMYR